jgi:hypothetical protein
MARRALRNAIEYHPDKKFEIRDNQMRKERA